MLFHFSTSISASRISKWFQICVTATMVDHGQPHSLTMVNHDWPSSLSQSVWPWLTMVSVVPFNVHGWPWTNHGLPWFIMVAIHEQPCSKHGWPCQTVVLVPGQVGLKRAQGYATVVSAFHHYTKKPTKCLKGCVSLPFIGSLRV